MEVGDEVYLAREIIEPASGDHPTFLLGYKGEKVTIVDYDPVRSSLNYLVEGPSNPGNPWYASRTDLMRTKPFCFN